MNCMKNFIVANKTLVFVIMPMIGFVLGVTAAKLTVDGCTCGKGIVKKAKKAFRTMEQSLPF